MTTRFKRLLWKTAIKLHKQTQGDKTSLKRQKQHKETQNNSKRTWESQNTKNTGYRRQRQQCCRNTVSGAQCIMGNPPAYRDVQGHLIQPEPWDQSYLCARHWCMQSHLYSKVMKRVLHSHCRLYVFSCQLWTRDFLRFYWFLHFPAAAMWLKWKPADTQVSQVRRCWRKP